MDNISFSGRILFVNKESYKNFINQRREINQLKHHCGNNRLTHFIQDDKDFFAITTVYEHELKIDEISSHVLSEFYNSPKREILEDIIANHINKIKDWKSNIDITPNYTPPERADETRQNFLERIKRIFKKR